MRFHRTVAVVCALCAALFSLILPSRAEALPGETSPETSSTTLRGPDGSVTFGSDVLVLENGNYVVVDRFWENPTGGNVGAVHLYDGATDVIISTLVGRLDGAVVIDLYEVGDSNVVVNWRSFVDDIGDVSWIHGTEGSSGVVSEDNSFIGQAGNGRPDEVEILTSGDYLVESRNWSSGGVAGRGAVTFGSGNTGLVGRPSAAISLIGSQTGDFLGVSVVELSNGNYVIVVPEWSNGPNSAAGAATWSRRGQGVTGEVSASNSLVGTQELDGEQMEVTALTNGNYAVSRPRWSNGSTAFVGAVTWADGTTGLSGTVSSTNSLIGSTPQDAVGDEVIPLANGNYLSAQSFWDRGPIGVDAGSVTWADGTRPTAAVVSTANSLHGKTADRVGETVVALANGHAMVGAERFDLVFDTDIGAATWMDGTQPTGAQVKSDNSVYGSSFGDEVGRYMVPLSDGNALLVSPLWNNGPVVDAGAVTWVSGSGPTVGAVSATNSLIGSSTDDKLGDRDTAFGFTPNIAVLDGGAYIVGSPFWDDSAGRDDVGAATWGSAGSGVSGVVDSANSLVGDAEGDQVGRLVLEGASGIGFVSSSLWQSGSGAITRMTPSAPAVGRINSSNSYVGQPFFGLGRRVLRLSSGDLVISVEGFRVGVDPIGGIGWIDGAVGRTGQVAVPELLIGAVSGDLVNPEFTELETGDVAITVTDFDRDGTPDAGATVLAVPGPDMSGPITARNAGFGEPDRPGPRLSASDSVVIPTDRNQVTLLRLDRRPFFESKPRDVSVIAPSGASSIAVDYRAPSAADVRDGPVVASCSPASGSMFPVGVTEVSCVATDSANFTAVTSFSVEVVSRVAILSIVPARLLDTRPSGETIDGDFARAGRLSAGGQIELQVTGRAGLPPDQLAAAVMNVTMIRPEGNGFVTAFPCGQRPNASSMNAPDSGGVVANELIAQLDSKGRVCLYSSTATDLAVDLTGFAAFPDGLRTLDPARVLDTRSGGETVDERFVGDGRLAAGDVVSVEVLGRAGVPVNGVGAVVANVTMIRPDGNGFLTVYPCGDRPVASSINAPDGGGVVANEVIAKLSSTGAVCVYSSVDTHIAMDVAGFVPEPSGVVSLAPARLLDTRPDGLTIDRRSEGSGRVPAAGFVELPVLGRGGVPATGVASVVLNVTMIRPDGNGFVTVYPCGERPLASSLNAPNGGGVVANEVIA
ncbi:MAG: HYR domain-containing protein, partial [Ilumatobacter sp.]